MVRVKYVYRFISSAFLEVIVRGIHVACTRCILCLLLYRTGSQRRCGRNEVAGLNDQSMEAMKKMQQEEGAVEDKLSQFLFRYRLTTDPTTGEAPAVLLISRRPRDRLDLLHPDLASTTQKRQKVQRSDHDRTCRARSFASGQRVYCRNFRAGPGVVEQQTLPVSFTIRLKDGRIARRHQNHLRARETTTTTRQEEPCPPARTDSTSTLEKPSSRAQRLPEVPTAGVQGATTPPSKSTCRQRQGEIKQKPSRSIGNYR